MANGAKRKSKLAVVEASELKLNLGCGRHKIEGFLGVDCRRDDGNDAVEKIHDLLSFPWPWGDKSVTAIEANYLLMYFDGPERMRFMDECWRVLKPGGKLAIKVVYWASVRCGLDPLYKAPPITEMSFCMYNKEWRRLNQHAHYPIKCDFDFTYGFALRGDLATRNQEYQGMAIQQQLNAADDLIVSLTKR